MINQYENRRFVTFDMSEVNLIDFNQVHETAIDTLRLSVDGLKSFVKYDIPQPASVAALQTKSEEYTYGQFIELLATVEWSAPMEME